jgi:hypothetical protein
LLVSFQTVCAFGFAKEKKINWTMTLYKDKLQDCRKVSSATFRKEVKMTKPQAAARALSATPLFKPQKVLKDRDLCTHLSSLIDRLTNKVENFSLPR